MVGEWEVDGFHGCNIAILSMHRALPYEEPIKTRVVLNNLRTPNNEEREADDNLETEHEYEIPESDMYDDAYDKVKVLSPKTKST